MEKPTLKEILKVYKAKGYKVFEYKDSNGKVVPFNLNIGGIRTNDMTPNTFNDFEFCFYKDENEQQKFYLWEITTDPGLYYLRFPLNNKGTAILAPGQYLGCWQIGLHKGKYKALVQSGDAVKVYRDCNRDDKYDYKEWTAEWGYFGIDNHRASKYRIVIYVNKFSAGCQVFKDPKDFDELMALCRYSIKYFPNRFSYTLMEEKDFC
ncbi:MAG: hypothetical protein WCE54_21670 [Ignavibacteriaceae bacterium]